MNHFLRLSRLLMVAGFAAFALAGCGKESPQALTGSSRDFIAKGDYKAAAIQLRNALKQNPEDGEARYLLGMVLSEGGDWASAEKELRKALEYQYSPDLVYPQLLRVMLRQGEAKKAVAEFSDKHLVDPAAEAALRSEVGMAHLGLGQTKEARASFAAALTAKPGFSKARIGEAIVAAQEQDIPGATRIVDEVLAQSPSLPEALSLRADLQLAQNDVGSAISSLEQVIKAEPTNIQARFAMATLLIRENKGDQARAAIAGLKKAAPRDVRGSYLDALLAYRQGDAAKTRESALQVLKVLPNHAPSLILAGAAEYRLGSLESAADHLRKGLSQMPQNDEARRLLVATMLRAGQPEKARDALEPALKGSTGNPRLLQLAGEVALANNDLVKAAQYYERATVLDKESTAARTRLAQVRLATGDVDRALSDLEIASERDAEQYQADLSLIAAHLRRRETDKALQAAAVLEKKQPNNPLTYNVKGIIYVSKRDTKNARASFAKAVELKPDYLPAVLNLAKLDLYEKNPQAAKARFETIIAAQPKNDGALVGLAQVLVLTGAPAKEIVATLERAISANPTSVSARLALANFHLRNRDAKAALQVAQAAVTVSPNDPRVLDILGNAQQATGDTNQAIATFNKLAAMRPGTPEPLLRLAAVHFAAKDYPAAMQELRKALKIKPDLIEARRELVIVQFASGKVDDAFAEARAIQKDFPKDATGPVLEGDLYAAQKKWAPAANAYREALKRQSTPPVVVRLHQVLENDGKSADAAALASKWLKDTPKDVVVRTYLGERALRNKDYKEASKYFKENVALQPENAIFLNNLAWVASELNDPAALGYAEKAYALAPRITNILDTYATILLKKGDVKRAVELLTEAAGRAPKAAEIRLHLAQALVESGDKVAARKELEAILQLGADVPQRAEAQALLGKL